MRGQAGKFYEQLERVACLRSMREDDSPMFWKLERLAPSMKDMVEIAHDLKHVAETIVWPRALAGRGRRQVAIRGPYGA